MHLIALNGSPKINGNTFQAIKLVTDELEEAGVTAEIIHVGNKASEGCRACGICVNTGKCVITTDSVNETAEKIGRAQGLLIGSPVHYASIAGTLKNYIDRLFFSAGRRVMRHKVAAAVVAVRRSGGMAAFHDLNSYFLIVEAIVPGSNYWNIIHGMHPGEILKDAEGVQTLRVLGRNMVWMMKLIEQGRGTDSEPESEEKQRMNFIR